MIVDIKEVDLESSIKSSEKVVIKFAFSEGCKSCKEFAPIYEKYSSEVKGVVTYNYDFGSWVNKHERIDDKARVMFKLETYPTVISFENGEMVNKFSGRITEELLGELFDKSSKHNLNRALSEMDLIELKAKKCDVLDSIMGGQQQIEKIKQRISREEEALDILNQEIESRNK